MKTCFKCGIEKDSSEFYAHKAMADGLLSKCKECTKADVSKNRRDKIDYYRSYDRKRGDLAHRVAARAAYAASERGKERQNAGAKAWIKRNKEKRAAHVILNNAVRDGNIRKPDECDSCGVSGVRIHGHHEDYERPIDVTWLCPACHTGLHKARRYSDDATEAPSGDAELYP